MVATCAKLFRPAEPMVLVGFEIAVCSRGLVCIMRFCGRVRIKEGPGRQKNRKATAGIKSVNTEMIASVVLTAREGESEIKTGARRDLENHPPRFGSHRFDG